ncbi:hypothetical protein SJAV_00800 [Sulfurisphaera javensis]|uniref:Uncharacterized protein n=1 Tax=Sulfurisphaera javensis TaxID=2049879 RepID=A0AAT9GMU3_9CREN
MNWGKIIGIVLAILFIILYFPTLQSSFQNGVSQINSLSNITNNLKVSIISFNKSELIINVKNPLNVSIIICNVSGEYIYLNKIAVVPPHMSENVTLIITNFSNLVNNINNKNETITIKLRILETTVIEATTL